MDSRKVHRVLSQQLVGTDLVANEAADGTVAECASSVAGFCDENQGSLGADRFHGATPQ